MNDKKVEKMPNDIPPFVKFCCANIPLVFDDSLSYYEALCALWKYLQECIDVINNNALLEEEFIEKFNILKDYVEHYFDNLDVQEEINNKLDEMARTGVLGDIIEHRLEPYIDAQNERITNVETEVTGFENTVAGQISEIDTKVDRATSGAPLAASSVAGMTDTTKIYVNTTDGKWYYYDGDSWEIGGVYQSSVVSNTDPVISQLTLAVDGVDGAFSKTIGKNKFDGQTRVGKYNVTTGVYDPSDTSTHCNVNPIPVEQNRWYHVSKNGSAANAIIIQYADDDSVISWSNANSFIPAANCTYVNLFSGSFDSFYMVSPSTDLTYEAYTVTYKLAVDPAQCFTKIPGKNLFDGEVRLGKYEITDGSYDPTDTSVRCNLNKIYVEPDKAYRISEAGVLKNAIVLQYASDDTLISWENANTITTDPNCSYINFYSAGTNSNYMVSSSTDLTYEPYTEINELNVNPDATVLEYIEDKIGEEHTMLKGKKILNLGDSLWGNFEGATSLSGIISNLTGATTYNCGFGGCRMTYRTDDSRWNAFSMCTLADAIASGNWTVQDNAVANPPAGMPVYFSDHLATLESLDFSEIDILTIGYGVNDYMGGKYVDNPDNAYDKTYVCGALRYSIEQIQTAYPNMKIVVVSPNFAVWFQNGQVWKTSDEPYYNASTGVTLPQVVEGLNGVAKEYHSDFINVYDNSGNNRYTAMNYFETTDGVHPNAKGRANMGRYIAVNLFSQ